MTELISDVKYKNVTVIKRYKNEGGDISHISEIIEVAQQRNTGQNIVERGWIDVLSP